MKKTVLSTIVLFVFGILYLGAGSSYSQGFLRPGFSGWDPLEASLMTEGQLTTASGDYLGRISDLVIDPESGHILDVVLSDVQGRGAEQISVPLVALSHDGSNRFVFDKDVAYRWRFSSIGGPYFEEPYMQWAEIQFIYSAVPMPAEAYRVSTLMGTSVRTPKGDEVGRVNDLVIDLTKDQVVYLVLSDVGEKQERMVAVPFNELSKKSGSLFTLHVTKEKLLDSPTFTWSDVSNRRYAENVYRYYGVQPYWSEE